MLLVITYYTLFIGWEIRNKTIIPIIYCAYIGTWWRDVIKYLLFIDVSNTQGPNWLSYISFCIKQTINFQLNLDNLTLLLLSENVIYFFLALLIIAMHNKYTWYLVPIIFKYLFRWKIVLENSTNQLNVYHIFEQR